MSFADRVVPSLNRSTASRAFGAPGFTAASSFSRAAVMTRIVAVAWTVADGAAEGVEAIAIAAASRNISNRNALAGEW